MCLVYNEILLLIKELAVLQPLGSEWSSSYQCMQCQILLVLLIIPSSIPPSPLGFNTRNCEWARSSISTIYCGLTTNYTEPLWWKMANSADRYMRHRLLQRRSAPGFLMDHFLLTNECHHTNWSSFMTCTQSEDQRLKTKNSNWRHKSNFFQTLNQKYKYKRVVTDARLTQLVATPYDTDSIVTSLSLWTQQGGTRNKMTLSNRGSWTWPPLRETRQHCWSWGHILCYTSNFWGSTPHLPWQYLSVLSLCTAVLLLLCPTN